MTLTDNQDDIIEAANEPNLRGSDFFMSVLDNEKDPVYKWHALKAIGELKAYEAKDRLLRTLSEPDYEFDDSSLHRICAWAIGRIGSSLTADVVLLLANAHCNETRRAAIDSLGEIRDEQAIPILAEQLTSSDRSIRLWAALSLAKVGEASIPVIDKALQNADEEMVLVLVDALAIIASPKTVPVFITAFLNKPSAVIEYLKHGPSERTENYTKILHQTEYGIPQQLCSVISALAESHK